MVTDARRTANRLELCHRGVSIRCAEGNDIKTEVGRRCTICDRDDACWVSAPSDGMDPRSMHSRPKVGDMHRSVPPMAAPAVDHPTICVSVVHPCRDPAPSKSCCKPQACRAHREVADKVPYKANELSDG